MFTTKRYLPRCKSCSHSQNRGAPFTKQSLPFQTDPLFRKPVLLFDKLGLPFNRPLFFNHLPLKMTVDIKKKLFLQWSMVNHGY